MPDATTPRPALRSVAFHGTWVALLVVAVGFAPWFVVGAAPGWLDVRELLNLGALLACPLAVVAAIRGERARAGGIGGGRAFLLGAAVAVAAALLACALVVLAMSAAGDALPQALYDSHLAALREVPDGATRGAGVAALEAGRPMLFSPLLQGVGTATMLLFAGLVATALAAPLLRSRG